MKLSIVILNHNTKKLLLGAIDSVQDSLRHTNLSHEIIVVDNASTDDSVIAVKKKHPHIKLIQLDKNLGFAAGNNQGIKQAKGKYLLLLNTDTQPLEDSLEHLVKYLDRHPRVGIVSPKLVLLDGSVDLSCHRGFPTLGNSLAYFLKLEQLLPNFKPFAGYHQTWKNFDQPHSVDAVSFAAALIRRQVIDQIGLMDERFFMYAEDIDFCKRAKDRGWKIIYYPKAVIVHIKGSSGSNSPDKHLQSQTRHHFYHTMKQYFRKHGSAPWALKPFVDLGIDILAKIKG